MKWLRVGLRAAARVVATVALVFLAATLFTELAPGSAGERAARAAGLMPADDSAVPAELRRELVRRIATAHGLDRPLTQRLPSSLLSLSVGDLGTSWRSGAPVRGPLVRAALKTAWLGLIALMVAFVLGAGSASAARLTRAGPLRTALTASASLFLVIPPVWLALLALRLDSGAEVVAAALCLSALPAALIHRHAAAGLRETLAAPHSLAARARGISEARLVLVHGTRAVAGALAALLPGVVGLLIGSSMVIESVFGIRGLGAALADAASAGDAPVVVAAVTLAAAAVAVASVAARIVQRACDPRIGEPR